MRCERHRGAGCARRARTDRHPGEIGQRMASTFRLTLDGTPADEDFYAKMSSLEIEENADMPGAIQLSLPVSRSEEGDLTHINDSGLQPFANLSVVATP